jgi:hypothetical protein
VWITRSLKAGDSEQPSVPDGFPRSVYPGNEGVKNLRRSPPSVVEVDRVVESSTPRETESLPEGAGFGVAGWVEVQVEGEATVVLRVTRRSRGETTRAPSAIRTPGPDVAVVEGALLVRAASRARDRDVDPRTL